MPSLIQDLQTPKNDLEEFRLATVRVLHYMQEMVDQKVDCREYLICSSTTAGTRKRIRPYNKNLFLGTANEFNETYNSFLAVKERLLKQNSSFTQTEFEIVDKTIYTMQQAIGIGFDLLAEPNSARKHVGNRFEELIKSLLSSVNIPIKKIVISIPYETDEGEKFYHCETDAIISPYDSVRSNSRHIEPNEIVLSMKTTTKDRMPKIFIDKILLEKFLGHPVRMIGISQNDIQRKDENGSSKISSTFVSNLFMVYSTFLARLEGYYYLDLPKKAFESPFNQYIFPFSKFFLNDVWRILRS